jgi:deazaflavin-dependent oxidoreductase (nitroreductase family)
MSNAVRRTRSTELVWKVHAFLYRLSGGRIAGRVGALSVLLLTVKGRKSGAPRTVALNYVEDAGGFVVYASHAGEDRDPPWWLNLRASGEADVQIGSRHLRVRATEAEGAERERLWAAVVARDASYDTYRQRTKRRIAVIVLTPI